MEPGHSAAGHGHKQNGEHGAQLLVIKPGKGRQLVFMTMCVSALALTTLDAVARIGKMSFQEIFSVDDMQHAALWRKVVCNPYFATIITLLCGYVLTKVGYQQIWPLFGSANQLLSALVLITLCVFLKVTGRKNKILFPPMIIIQPARSPKSWRRSPLSAYPFR